MKRISAADQKRINEYVQRLNDAKAEINAEIEAINEAIEAANSKINTYNEVFGEVALFAEDIASEQQNYMDERSEKWLEGDAGQQYSAWREAWEEFGQWEELEQLQPLEILEPEHAEQLEGLPTNPDQM